MAGRLLHTNTARPKKSYSTWQSVHSHTATGEYAPRAGRVGEGREIFSLRIVGAESGDDFCDLLARDRRSRTERTICIAGNQPEIDQHPDRARITDLRLIEKKLSGCRGRRRRQRARRQDQKNGQTKSKHPFHGVLSLPYFTEYQYNEAAV